MSLVKVRFNAETPAPWTVMLLFVPVLSKVSASLLEKFWATPVALFFQLLSAPETQVALVPFQVRPAVVAVPKATNSRKPV